jgi:hypothetical protein
LTTHATNANHCEKPEKNPEIKNVNIISTQITKLIPHEKGGTK